MPERQSDVADALPAGGRGGGIWLSLKQDPGHLLGKPADRLAINPRLAANLALRDVVLQQCENGTLLVRLQDVHPLYPFLNQRGRSCPIAAAAKTSGGYTANRLGGGI